MIVYSEYTVLKIKNACNIEAAVPTFFHFTFTKLSILILTLLLLTTFGVRINQQLIIAFYIALTCQTHSLKILVQGCTLELSAKRLIIFQNIYLIPTSFKVLKTAKKIVIVKDGRNVQYESLLNVGYFGLFIGNLLLMAIT